MGEQDRHQIRKDSLLLAVDEKREAEIAGDAGQAPKLLPVSRADLLAMTQPVEDEGGGHVGHLAVARPRAGVDPLVKPEIDQRTERVLKPDVHRHTAPLPETARLGVMEAEDLPRSQAAERL